MRSLSLCLLSFSILVPALLSGQIVRVPIHQFGIDQEANTVLCRARLAQLNANTPDGFQRVETDGTGFNLNNLVNVLRYGVPYNVTTDDGTGFELQFTNLPLIHINPYDSIPNAEKRPTTFTYADNDQTLEATAGIEIRGGFTARLAKKTYDLEFWTDTTGTDNVDVSFGDLRSDDDWILDAVVNEPLRVNSFVAHQLWLDMYQLPYAAEEPNARSGADVRWCEVFRGGSYEGVYFLSEQVDRKQLKLKKYREDENLIRGELYKTTKIRPATNYQFLPAPPRDAESFWSGFDAQYPDLDGSRWGTLYDLLTFAINSNDATFEAELDQYFDVDNLVDYFLFINLISAEDNSRKNNFYARYAADEPFLLVPWDLDGTFGNRWNGENANFPNDSIFSNRLYQRIIRLNAAGFNDKLCTRYTNLKATGLFKVDSLNARIRREYDYLKDNGVYQREERRWPGTVNASDSHLSYTFDWNEDRMTFLSAWSCDMTVSIIAPAAAPSFSLFPNPTRGNVWLRPIPPRPIAWSLFTLAGQCLQQGQINAGANHLRIDAQLPGMYLLRIGNGLYKIIVI